MKSASRWWRIAASGLGEPGRDLGLGTGTAEPGVVGRVAPVHRYQVTIRGCVAVDHVKCLLPLDVVEVVEELAQHDQIWSGPSAAGESGRVNWRTVTLSRCAHRWIVRQVAVGAVSVAQTVPARAASRSARWPVPQAGSQAIWYRGRRRDARTMSSLRCSYHSVATCHGSGSSRYSDSKSGGADPARGRDQ